MDTPIEVRRSARRTRTVSAFRETGRLVVAIPARFTAEQEREWVARMVERMARRERRRQPGDEELGARAAQLSGTYLGGKARPASVRWVTNQGKRWGSCTPSTGEIRLSHHLQGMPSWVVDCVLLHELAHLLEPRHNARFRELVEQHPRSRESTAFLEGVSWARDHGSHAGEETP